MPAFDQLWDCDFHERSPLFEAYLPITRYFSGRKDWPGPAELTAVAEASRRQRAPDERPLQFVSSLPKSRRSRPRPIDVSELYDGRIASKGEVPCLPASYHDLFNAIVFAAFPRAKRALHARQHAVQKTWIPHGATRLPSKRTREQDALTIFDEGGSVVAMTERLFEKWSQSERPLTLEANADVQVLVFGHAILELLHASAPSLRAPIRSSALVLPVSNLETGTALLEQVDRWLRARLTDPREFVMPQGDSVLIFEPGGRLCLGVCRGIKAATPT